MKLIRYSNKNDYSNALERWFDRAFSELWSNRWSTLPLEGLRTSEVPVDLYEDADNFYARFELPGVQKKDLKVELKKDSLTVVGERKRKDKEEEQSYAFTRTVSIPEGVKADSVKAQLQEGLLTVTLPKAEQSKPKSITVN